MLIGTIGFGAAVLFLAAVGFSRSRPFDRPPVCPSCAVAYIEMPQGHDAERRTYDVLVCPHCTNCSTRVLGASSRFAWCPKCRQRTLETPVRRLPPTLEAPIAVEVDELCHLCGFEATTVLPSNGYAPIHNNVLPFRRRR